MIHYIPIALLGGIFGAREVVRGKPPGLEKSMRLIKDLDPSIQPMAKRLIKKAWRRGISLVVTSGYRSSDQQAKLYAQGRTASGPRVTGAKPGFSWHNHKLAFDVAILKDGKPTWPEDKSLWAKIGKIGKSVGLSWGGDWKKPDRPHFEYHPGINIREAMAGKRPKKPSLITLV